MAKIKERAMLGSIVFWFTFAFILAGLEIEAEGKYGWAEKMPTWYRTRGLAADIYGLFMAGKPLTGYHLWGFLMPLAAVHTGFFTGAPWSISAEFVVLSRYFAFAVVWDFLWFVLNPHYGIQNFKKENIWWHAKSYWVLGLFPADYAVGVGISLLCAFCATKFGAYSALMDQVRILLGLAALTLVTIILAPNYHDWHRKMRVRDDRDTAGIFHKLPIKIQ